MASSCTTESSSASRTGSASRIGCFSPTAAIYDFEGLTHQGDLDGFWEAPQPPDPTLFDAFRRVVIARTQINGAYATRHGVDLAVPEAARRLLSA
jgi:capsular polysaccharide export protein